MSGVQVSIKRQHGVRRALTPAQELIWTSQRLAPDAPLMNMATVCRFDRAIDPERFVAAFESVVMASDALRMVFGIDNGMPFAEVSDRSPARTSLVSLPSDAVASWMRNRIATPIDVTQSSYDSVLIESEGSWIWWLDLHHLVTDAASSALVYRATAAAYHGEPFELGSYGDLTDAMTSGRSSDRWVKAARRWGGSTTSLSGPALRDGSTQSERIDVDLGERQRPLDALFSGRFRGLSRDITILTTLATATAAYLHRIDGSGEVTIGVPVHHRHRRDARSVIGPLIELFPLQVSICDGDEPAPSFADLHEQVSRQAMDLLKWALPGTSPRQDFDVVLNVHGATFGSFGDIGCAFEWVPSGHVDSHHRLRVQALDYVGDGELDLLLDINTGDGSSAQRQRAGEHLGAVIDAMVADPDASIGSFSLVGDAERRAQAALIGPARGSSEHTLVQRLSSIGRGEEGTDRIVIRQPDADGGAIELFGAEFSERVLAVARWLQSKGVRLGDRVAVEMPISIDAVVAIHAVLAAGAAFVPIDPDYPEPRRQHLRTDSGAVLVITSLPTADQLGRARPLSITPLPLLPVVSADDLAYVIYTSGSTGLPKGVPITHGGLIDYLDIAAERYVARSEAPEIPLFSSLSFDLTITSLFLPFLTDGTLTVHPGGAMAALRSIADERRATVLKATPSHLELLVRMLDADHPLRTIVVGGEAFQRPLAADLIRVLGDDVVLINEYGPTEAVVGCMEHRFDAATDTAIDVPIGRAAAGVSLRVVDRYDQPVPTGVDGELLIRRPGMTSGYLGQPQRTAERFVTIDGDRWYRSGDRVRLVDDRTVVYLGRLDAQIKVRGVRLEPGEIEVSAAEHPGVRRAVVSLWTPAVDDDPHHCPRCGLASNVPGITFDDDGICSTCRAFDAVAPQAVSWFKTRDDLRAELASAKQRRAGDYDVLLLLSGGKDSTYVLYQLVAMGADVLALTLDNGFISEGAMDNVRRAAAHLGVDHEFVTTDAMNEIFRDSLERFSNVCNGCYKTIYTLAINRADELGIPAIVTGLSRGQFFETRLLPSLFEGNDFDPADVDAMVTEARKAYHRTDDAVQRHLDVSRFDDDTIFDRVSFIDFYRYVDVELQELYRYLDEETTWSRPADTGRSTNCLINAAGIYVHRIEQGHHSYALPYSWDVKLGHKQRDEALEELDDPMDDAEMAAITEMLAAVGYEPRAPEILTVWFEGEPGRTLDPADLRTHLAERLPTHAIPAAFVEVDHVPLTTNGKVDWSALPAPRALHRSGERRGRAPETPTEIAIADVWREVLRLDGLGVDDDFFDLGGASLAALEMAFVVSDRLGREVPEAMVFRHRTVATLGEAIDHLVPDSRDRMGSGERSGSARSELVDGKPEPPGDGGITTFSAGELALLYEWRKAPDDARYGGGWIIDLEATRLAHISDDDLIDAIRTVIAHQPTLHTSYGADRRALDIDEALAATSIMIDPGIAIGDWATTRNTEPFDLIDGPLVTADVVRHGADAQHNRVGRSLVLRTHHICGDAGSMDVLWRQIRAVLRGERLPVLATSYAEFAADSTAALRHEDRGFWLDRLAIAPSSMALLAPGGGAADGQVRRVLDVDQAALRAGDGSGQWSTAVAPILAAAARALVAVHDGPVVELSLATSLRDRPQLGDLVGYFVNLLPLRMAVDREQAFVSTAEQFDRALLDALVRRSVPFSQIVRDARANGVVEPTGSIIVAVNDRSAVGVDVIPPAGAISDLGLIVDLGPDGTVTLHLDYDGRRLDQRGATELLDHIAVELETGVGIPGAAPETTKSVIDGPPLSVAADLVPVLIERVAAEHPSALAIRCGSVRVTYGELAVQARTLAARLASSGVRRGDRVAIVLPRSTDQLVAIRAIWILGAVYVPIDIAQPSERRRVLCEAAEVSAVVGAADLDGVGPLPLITPWETDSPAPTPIETPGAVNAADDAYVIFTSGSTGVPKPVAITHGNLAASTAARGQYYRTSVERYLMLSSIGFDSSVAGLFWTLVDGGELVIPTEEQVHDIDAVLALAADADVTHLLAVPSLYGALLDRQQGELGALRVAIVAGEACPPALVERHLVLAPQSALHNEYGPTEATVWATVERLDEPALLDGPAQPADRIVPIGRPIPGVRIAVIGHDERPVAFDVSGELVIGGSTVAIDHAIELPIDAPSERSQPTAWYRTGDRVVARRDGRMEFLGRIDHQLSVGGVRVEPEEIEQSLMAVNGVARVGVTSVGRRLVALVEGPSSLEGPLRSAAARTLSPSMQPAAYHFVAALPVTANGKLDRSRLDELPAVTATSPASPGAAMRDRITSPDPASSTSTAAVVDLWKAVLSDRSISADSDLFDVGGDSLAAMALVVGLEDLSGRRVGIGELVELRTPRLQAIHLLGASEGLVGAEGARTSGGLVEWLRRHGDRTPIVALPGGGGNLIRYAPFVDALPEDQPVVGLRLPGADADTDPLPTIELQADALLPELRRAQPDGPYRLFGWSTGGLLAWELAQRLIDAGDEVEQIVLVDTFLVNDATGGIEMSETAKGDKYATLLRNGGPLAIVDELRSRVVDRARAKIYPLRYRMHRAQGKMPDLRHAERTLGPMMRDVARRYEPQPLDLRSATMAPRVLFFAASATERSATVEPWQARHPELEVYEVDGVHFRPEDRCIIGPGRVDAIARHL